MQILFNQKKYLEFGQKITSEDKKKLNELFPLLTAEQKKNVPIIVFDRKDKLEKNVPQDSQLKEFLDSKKYAVWIDGKKIKNVTLNNYKKEDFSTYFVSKVHNNARTATNPQPFQVNFMTNKYYSDFQKKENIQIGLKVNDTVKQTHRNIESSLISPPMTRTQMKNSEDAETSPSLAHFPGGSQAFRGTVLNEFNTAKFLDKKGVLKTTIYFVVDKNGKAQSFKAEGTDEVFNQESLRAVQKIAESQTWKPALQDGKPFDYVFKLPLTMTFE